MTIQDLYYFSEGKKGLVSKIPHGKIIFPHKTSKIKHAGFAVVTDYKNDQYEEKKYSFVDGFNIKTEEIKQENILNLIFKYADNLLSISKAKTKEGIEGLVLEFKKIYRPNFAIFYNNKWHLFGEDDLTTRTFDKGSNTWYEKREELYSKEDIENLLNIYGGVNFRVSSYYKNSIKQKFIDAIPDFNYEIEDEIVKPANLGLIKEGLFTKRNSQLQDYFDNNLFEKAPLIIQLDNLVRVSDHQDLFEKVKKYNEEVIEWWQKEGLKLFNYSIEFVRFIFLNLQTSPLYKEIKSA